MSYHDEERENAGMDDLKQLGKAVVEQIPGVSMGFKILETVKAADGFFDLTDYQKEKLFLLKEKTQKHNILKQCAISLDQFNKMEVMQTWQAGSNAMIQKLVTRLGGIAFKITAMPVGVKEARSYWVWHQNPIFKGLSQRREFYVKEAGVAKRHILMEPIKVEL